MKKIIFTLLFGLGALNTAAAVEGNAEAGKTKAGVCAACHGANGISAIPNYPDLAGQHGAYIAKQLKAFKEGSRKDPVMAPMAAALSEQDMADLGAYFQGLGRAAATPAAEVATEVAQDVAQVAQAEVAAVANEVKSEVASTILSVAEEAAAATGGDMHAGKAKSAACAACHGADGNSLVPMYPKLAGQSATYIAKQLADFKKGMASGGKEGRNDPVMAPMTMALSAQDMIDLGAFFSAQKAKPGDGKKNEAGHKLFFGGDSERGITACAACHTPGGKGMDLAGFPAVATQSVTYLKGQLEKFRSGARANDSNGMMRNIATKLTDEDIEAVAQYMSSL